MSIRRAWALGCGFCLVFVGCVSESGSSSEWLPQTGGTSSNTGGTGARAGAAGRAHDRGGSHSGSAGQTNGSGGSLGESGGGGDSGIAGTLPHAGTSGSSAGTTGSAGASSAGNAGRGNVDPWWTSTISDVWPRGVIATVTGDAEARGLRLKNLWFGPDKYDTKLERFSLVVTNEGETQRCIPQVLLRIRDKSGAELTSTQGEGLFYGKVSWSKNGPMSCIAPGETGVFWGKQTLNTGKTFADITKADIHVWALHFDTTAPPLTVESENVHIKETTFLDRKQWVVESDLKLSAAAREVWMNIFPKNELGFVFDYLAASAGSGVINAGTIKVTSTPALQSFSDYFSFLRFNAE